MNQFPPTPVRAPFRIFTKSPPRYWQLKAHHRCRWYRWCTLTCEYLFEFSKNFENAPFVIVRGLEEDYLWKNLKQKISWHCPFKKFTKSGSGLRSCAISAYIAMVPQCMKVYMLSENVKEICMYILLADLEDSICQFRGCRRRRLQEATMCIHTLYCET